jgi:hypothetical protein
MPGLKIGILLHEQFKIGNILVTMKQVKGPTNFVVELQKSMKEQFEINDKRPVEVMPGVTIMSGQGVKIEKADGRIAYRPVVIIDAPEHIKITRLKGEERFAKV